MKEIEWRRVTPEEFVWGLEEGVGQRRENKYAFQTGIKDVEFETDEDKALAIGFALPLEIQTPDQAEWALRQGVITPTTLVEDDNTHHQIAIFDPQPVGSSGYMGVCTHSLALTDQGLFEVGRYPAMSLKAAFEGQANPRYWQWFLHRRLATAEQAAFWQEEDHLSPTQVVERFFEAMTGRSRHI